MTYISEAEFRLYAKRKREELARAVADSGLTTKQIATGTRMKWDTVRRIALGKTVRNESQDRVRCYLEANKQTTPEQ